MVDSTIHKLGIGLQIRYLNSEKIKFPCAITLYASHPRPFPSCTFFPNFSSFLGKLSNSKEPQCFPTTPFHRRRIHLILYHHHFSIFDLLHQFFFTVRWIVQIQRVPHVFQQHAFTPSFSTFNHGRLGRKQVIERYWPKIQYAGTKDNHMSMPLMGAWLSNYMNSYVWLLTFKNFQFFLLLR